MARGQFEDALDIYTSGALPVLEELGDVRSRAIAQGRVADILQERGQLNDALAIRTEELSPVFEQLGDIHSYAINQGRIADILEECGQFDDALQTYEKRVLPTIEALKNPTEVRAQVRARIRELQGETRMTPSPMHLDAILHAPIRKQAGRRETPRDLPALATGPR